MKTKQPTFEEEIQKEFEQSGFGYQALNSGHIFSNSPGGPVLYKKALITDGDKQMLFCSPNESAGEKVDDARSYANKDLVRLLMINGVGFYSPGKSSQLTYGAMASRNGAVINRDSLQFTLSPEDARNFNDQLHSFGYVIMKGSYHNFARIHDKLEEVIYTSSNSGGVVESRRGPLLVSSGAIGSVDVLGQGDIRVLRGNEREVDFSGYSTDDKQLLETEEGGFVIYDGNTFFSAHELPQYPFQEKDHNRLAVDVFSNEKLAKKALERWTLSECMDEHKDYNVVKLDSKLIGSL